MKRIFTLLLLTVAFGLNAQERYLDEIFDEVQVTEDVEYASNITVITALQLSLIHISEPTRPY